LISSAIAAKRVLRQTILRRGAVTRNSILSAPRAEQMHSGADAAGAFAYIGAGFASGREVA
jgi:hypothetical protein